MNTRMFKTGDILLMVGVAAIALLFTAWQNLSVSPGGQITAVITQDGNLVEQIGLNDLKAPASIEINEPIHQVILAENGRIRFSESDCPNKICVKTGWLNKPGDRAVCTHSKVIITIVGDNKEVDTLAY